MHFTTKPFQIFFTAGALLLLTACGGAPSDSEIKDALLKKDAATSKMLEGFNTSGRVKVVSPVIKNVHKIDCKEAGEKVYRCNIEVTSELSGQSTKEPQSVAMVKGSDGWSTL